MRGLRVVVRGYYNPRFPVPDPRPLAWHGILAPHWRRRSEVKGERCGQVYDGRPLGVTASPAVPWARRFTAPSPGEHLRPHRAGARHQRPAREPARAVVEAARAAGGGAALARPGAAAGPPPPRRLAPRRAPPPCAPTGPSPRKETVGSWMRRPGADASARPAVPVAYQVADEGGDRRILPGSLGRVRLG